MPRLAPDQKHLVTRECEGLTGPERTRMIRDLAARLGCHPSTIYRLLPKDDRRRRADCGQRRCAVPGERLEKMFALSAKDLSSAEVIDLAVRNGWIAPGALSPATYNRYLAQEQLSKRQRHRFIRPFRFFEESFSNERHYLDITRFEDYFVAPDDAIGYESILQHSKNRAGNGQPRLQLFLLVDGYSRVKFGRLYRGKHVLNWIDFLVNAWSVKEDATPFQGRPHHLYSDNEGVFRSPLMIRFLQAMDVHSHAHRPGVPRAKGKVEKAIGDVARGFRHLLRLQVYERADKPPLGRANDLLLDVLARGNQRVHARTRQEPLVRWRSGFPPNRPLRLMPDTRVAERFFYARDHRVIQGDLTLQLLGTRWQLPRQEPFLSRSGCRVPVCYHPGAPAPTSVYVVIDEVEYEIPPATPVIEPAGEYRALAESNHENRLKELDAVDLSDLEVDGFTGSNRRRSFLPAEGEALDVEALKLPRRAFTRLRLLHRLLAEGVIATPPRPPEKAYLDALYAGDGDVYEDELDAIIEGLSGVAFFGRPPAT